MRCNCVVFVTFSCFQRSDNSGTGYNQAVRILNGAASKSRSSDSADMVTVVVNQQAHKIARNPSKQPSSSRNPKQQLFGADSISLLNKNNNHADYHNVDSSSDVDDVRIV